MYQCKVSVLYCAMNKVYAVLFSPSTMKHGQNNKTQRERRQEWYYFGKTIITKISISTDAILIYRRMQILMAREQLIA